MGSGCCCGTICNFIFTGVVTIVQASIHLIFCVLFIYVYRCALSVPDHIATTLWYITYFRSECSTFNLSSLSSLMDYTLEVDGTVYTLNDIFELSEDAPASATTYAYLKAYVITDGIWIASAILLLIGACCNVKGKATALFYSPWIICSVGIAVFDVIVVVWFAGHITETNTLLGWSEFVGLENRTTFNITSDEIQFDREYFLSIPSMIMVVIFSRLGIVWLINLILFFMILCNGFNDCKTPPPRTVFQSNTSSPYKPFSYADNSYLHNPDLITPRRSLSDRVDPNSKEARIRRWQLYYGEDATDLKVSKPRDNYPSNDITTKDNRDSYAKDTSQEQPYWRARLKQPSPTTDAHNSNFDQSDYAQPVERERTSWNGSSGYETASQDSWSFTPSAPIRTSDETKYNVELRSQLPWSYLQDPRNVRAPKTRSQDIMPPVPVPDYTLKIAGYKERKKVY